MRRRHTNKKARKHRKNVGLHKGDEEFQTIHRERNRNRRRCNRPTLEHKNQPNQRYNHHVPRRHVRK